MCQHVATAVANSLYNDIVMNVRYTVRPYLTYQTGKIVADDDDDAASSSTANAAFSSLAAAAASAAPSFDGKLANGDRFELKNVRLDNAKNNMAKIYFVQTNNTADQTNAAELRLRLLDLAGECDFAVTAAADGKSHAAKLTFAFQTVRVVPTLNFDEKTVHTRVFVGAPTLEFKPNNGAADLAAVWTDAREQLTTGLVEYFKRTVADATSRNIRNAM